MAKYFVTLELDTDYNPNKWNWHELLDLSEELVSVDVERVEEAKVNEQV